MFNIENFERVCNFSRANGVPPDYVKCTMFPFSLDGKEARWLASLPTGHRGVCGTKGKEIKVCEEMMRGDYQEGDSETNPR
ncbi:hypothetical protein F2Q68_00010222 [Brassica cretica]|uniref:Uncharacterized protein n=1 Tax=Brassica cretica TaxID=69181 RepID=A0A8S9KSY8_BRACR|nr:hypothetical protein F2Q68_00010222 [Brassica cretica]